MDKAALVKKIVAAKGYTPEDGGWLEALTEGQLEKIAAHCGCSAAGDGKDPATAATTATAPAATQPEVTAATATPAKAPTEEEWLAAAPEGMRELFVEARAEREAEEAQLRKDIVANSGGVYVEADLAGMKRDGLKKVAAALAAAAAKAKPDADFRGNGVRAHDASGQTAAKTHAEMPGIKIGAGA